MADANVCSHSFGALVALQLAAGSTGSRVRSLVLMEATPAGVLIDPGPPAYVFARGVLSWMVI